MPLFLGGSKTHPEWTHPNGMASKPKPDQRKYGEGQRQRKRARKREKCKNTIHRHQNSPLSSSYETTERQYCQLCAALLYTHVYIHAYIRKMTITTIQTKKFPPSHCPTHQRRSREPRRNRAPTQKDETARHTSAEGREEGEKTDLAVMNQSSACCLQSTRVWIWIGDGEWRRGMERRGEGAYVIC